MWEPLFDNLRTKQQIGYSVGCSTRNTLQTLGFTISLVSATHTPLQMEEAVSEFLVKFLDSLDIMSAEAYSRNVEACVQKKLQEDHNVNDEFQRHGSEIEDRQFLFDRLEREAAALRTIDQQDLTVWARNGLLRLGEGSSCLSVHVYKKGVAVSPPPGGCAPVACAEMFKAGLLARIPAERPTPQA